MNTVGELLASTCTRHRDRVAIVHGSRQLTYGELLDRAGRFAQSLRAIGVEPNDRVAAFMSDGLESVEVFVGCALAGVTLVPVNARFLAGEATHVVHDSQAAALVYTTSLGDIATRIDGLDELRAVIAIGDGDRVASAHAYESLLATARSGAGADPVGPSAVAPEDIAVIGYTSGTTGFPKGARCSHRAVTTCTRLVPYVQGMVTNGAGTFIGSFSFVSALWGILYPHLWTGATLRLADPADPDAWIDHMARDRCTYTWVPSPLIRFFRDEMSRRPEILTRLNTVVHTGSKVPREFLISLVDVIGPRLIETWGLTESVGPLSATTRADFAELTASNGATDVFASVGRAVPTTQLALLGRDGTIRIGEAGEGELLARADTMFSGYLGVADDDPEAWVDGWFRTGDVGRIDDDGYIYIEDRSKDVIVSGGMNVYPAEVEMALATLPGVVECAVFAVSDDRWGETVAAAVVVTPDSGIADSAIIDHVRARLASYKKPTRVFFLDALPRNASMKVQKRVLRAMFDDARSAGEAGNADDAREARGAQEVSSANLR